MQVNDPFNANHFNDQCKA
ncbi:unnamed protein product, partial [Rotaria sordida]